MGELTSFCGLAQERIAVHGCPVQGRHPVVQASSRGPQLSHPVYLRQAFFQLAYGHVVEGRDQAQPQGELGLPFGVEMGLLREHEGTRTAAERAP